MLQTILLGEDLGNTLCAPNGPVSQQDVGRCVRWASHVLQGASSRIVLVIGTYDATARSYASYRNNNTDSATRIACNFAVATSIRPNTYHHSSLYQLCVDRLHRDYCAAPDRDTADQCSMFEQDWR
jgi:hypothetical protein